MSRFAAILLSAMLLPAAAGALDDSTARQQNDQWRAQRLERLETPYGWPSLIGLEWLKQGANKIGSAKDNDIVIAKAPAHLGVVTLHGDKASIALADGADATIDETKKTQADLLGDGHGKPTTVAFGTVRFYLIVRGDRYGLRIKDSEAQSRKLLIEHGVESFDFDPSWRVVADWQPYAPPHLVEGSNILGQVEKFQIVGKATFVRDGKTYSVEPMLEDPRAKELFLVFSDRTSGKETYGAARMLSIPMPKDGKIVIDFNEAYNPPCAFTPYATCPLPTPGNRLGLRVAAGEKKWRYGHEG